jgi:hypothetical protein
MPMRRSTIARFRFHAPLVALLLVAPVAADDHVPPVSIKIRPAVLFAGGEVRTTVKTPRDPRNRGLRIIVEAADYYASSDVQIDGVDGAASQPVHVEVAARRLLPCRGDPAARRRREGDVHELFRCAQRRRRGHRVRRQRGADQPSPPFRAGAAADSAGIDARQLLTP